MKAIRIHQFGEPEVMRFENVPDPTLRAAQGLPKHDWIQSKPKLNQGK
jgi:NADPH:quinone reductase-like Zn-dependent oxidoreductase